MGLSLAQRVAKLPAFERDAWIHSLPLHMLEEINRGEWWWTARPEQVPPAGNWLVALALAGRGWGKSRAGAEWLVEKVLKHPFDRNGQPTEWLLIGETLADTRTICMEGPAGLLRVLTRRGIDFRYKQSPRPMVLFPDGSRIYAEGADDEDVGRGYNAAGAWVDEICKWPKSYESWYEGILPSLRTDLIDDHPRCFATTTPKPIKLLQEWVKRDDGTIHIMGGSTFDNATNLSSHVLRELRVRYGNSDLGQQELYGKLLELGAGGLFKRMDIVKGRVTEIPTDIVSTIVGVDPNLTGEDDLFGIVVVARTVNNDLYVLEDASVEQSGRTAALAAWRAMAKWGADTLVYEENLGKRYLAEVLQDAYKESVALGLFPEHSSPSMYPVHAKHGKRTRAEPVAMRNEQGRLHMVGEWESLETEMTMFDPESTRESPDRMDALVHGCLHLMRGERRVMRVAQPSAQEWNLGQEFYDLSQLQPQW
jgi:phage terminase large subunit-like protein